MTQTEQRELVFVKEGEEYIAIRLRELEELVNQLDEQPVWASGMKWLTKQTGGRSAEWLRTELLLEYRDELESFVAYPEKSGQPWRFNIKRMKDWLAKDKTFKKVNR